MGPFLDNSFVINMGVGQGVRLNSPRQLSVPYGLLSRTLVLIHHRGMRVEGLVSQASARAQAPLGQKPEVAAPEAKQTQPASTSRRRSRAS